jgi:hypothetical protein
MKLESFNVVYAAISGMHSVMDISLHHPPLNLSAILVC